MTYEVTKIDWDIEDEDRDDNGLPITAKDLGLPAYDEVVKVECDGEEDIADVLSDEYGYCVNSFSILLDSDDYDYFGNEGEGRAARHDL